MKLIIFDLDGVLVNSREMHYKALNMALGEVDERYVVSRDEHIAKYDGYSTSKKLKMLTIERGLPAELYDQIWARKQQLTQQFIDEYEEDIRLKSVLAELKARGYMLYCASNSIWETMKNVLLKKGLLPYIDYFVSNQEVRNPKPSPEIYFKCFEHANLSPGECLICEDSPVGLKAAAASGARVCRIMDPDDLTVDRVLGTMSMSKVNVVIPAAGLGSRFAAAGYTFPKPLIDVCGKPMIQLVVENMVQGKFIFIVQREHYEKYNMKYFLNAIAPGCVIVPTDGLTEGSACSVLLAKEHIDNDCPLVIANSDQLLDWDAEHFLYLSKSEGVDGCISTFEHSHPKFSYAKCDDSGFVTEVAEKKVISKNATTGVYYWKRGSDCVRYTEQMIAKNLRVNNEFYNCPVFNEAIQDGKRIKTVKARQFWCLGTPEDLDYYIKTK